MFRANLKKAVVMGLGMALLSSNIVFAQLNTDQEAEVKAQITEIKPEYRSLMGTEELIAPDEGVSIANIGSGETAEAGGGTDGNAASDETVPPEEELIFYTTVADTDGDALTASDSDLAGKNEIADPDQPISSDEELKIQITSVGASADAEEERLRTLAAESAPVKLDTETKKVNTSLMVLAIAGGAAVIGGAVLVSKKKNNK
ncbi:MAG: hypothetical protein GX757_06550 [Clostridiales bacterium]|nr:hypothetical protein [Clostridiales bacterium]